MRHVRILGLCLVAVFMLGAVMVSGASAKTLGTPELGKCAEVGEGGQYASSNCTVKAPKRHGAYQGAYEWKPNSEGEGGLVFNPETTSVTFETRAGHKIECSHVQAESDFTLFNTSQATTPLWLLEGCKAEGEPCTTVSIGSEPERISNKLYWYEEEGRGWDGQLGFVEGKGTPSPVVGLSFASVNRESGERESFFTPIVCGPTAQETEEGIEPGEHSLGTVLLGGDKEEGAKGLNSFIGTIGPVNQPVEEFTVTYNENAQGIQSPQRFLHHEREYLQAFVHNEWEPVAVKATMTFEVGRDRVIRTKK